MTTYQGVQMETTSTRTAGDLLKGDARLGDLVSYTDAANPPRTYTIVGTPNDCTDYRLRSTETGEEIFSDCRQAGWRLEAPAIVDELGLPATRYGAPFELTGGRYVVRCLDCSTRSTAIVVGVDEAADHDAAHGDEHEAADHALPAWVWVDGPEPTDRARRYRAAQACHLPEHQLVDPGPGPWADDSREQLARAAYLESIDPHADPRQHEPHWPA